MCQNPQFLADLVTFTEEILNGKLYFLCSNNPLNFVYLGSRTSLKLIRNTNQSRHQL